MTRLKFERLNLRVSQHGLAQIARLSQPTVGLIENGRLIPTAQQLTRLGDALRVSPHELLKDVAVLGPTR